MASRIESSYVTDRWLRYQDALRLADLCGEVALAVDRYDRATADESMPREAVDKLWGRMERLMQKRSWLSQKYARMWMSSEEISHENQRPA